MNNKISVIVPVYNSEKWISKCLESIINQTYKNLEVIVINDGSTDKSREICDKYIKLDKRITLINQENKGVSESRNLGLDLSTGDFIVFVDSDDWIEPNMLELLVDRMIISNSDLVICGLNITKLGEIIRTPKLDDDEFMIRDSEDIYWHLRKINLGPCNKIYKKIYIKNKFDTTRSLGEDSIFVMEYMKNIKKVSTIEKCLYNVRLDNEESLNRKYRSDRLELVLELRKKEIDSYIEIYGENCNKSLLYNQYILAIHSCFRDSVKYQYKKDSLKYIEKYMKKLSEEIEYAANESSFKRNDYKIFNYVLKLKNKYFIYYFFKLKLMLSK